jgi:hypothetical protein
LQLVAIASFAFLRDRRDATTPVDAATVIGIMDVVRRFWPLLQPRRAAVLTPRGPMSKPQA